MLRTSKNFFLFVTAALLLAGANKVSACVGKKEAADNTGNSIPSNFAYSIQPDTSLQVNGSLFKAGLLYDVSKKKIVWEKNVTSVFPIASLTKMMVALLAVEDVRAGKYNWNDRVEWMRQYTYKVNHKRVKTFSKASYILHDLFKMAMIESNNEAAEQMARYIGGGNLDETIQRMNSRARELAMNSTYYGNPTGLPSNSRIFDNASSPGDLLNLSMEMLKYDEILRVTGMDYADIQNGKNTSIIRNHNHLAIDYKGDVDGLKTGYTRRAGFCLVATSNKCGHRMVSIVLGARAPITRNTIVKNMFDDYYTAVGLDKLTPANFSSDNYASNNISDEDENQSEGQYEVEEHEVNKIHVVQRGELLAMIAAKYNCTTSQIKEWNHLRGSRVPSGKPLLVKVMTQEKVWVTNQEKIEDAEVCETQTAELQDCTEPQAVQTVAVADPAKPKFVYHVIMPGDTLFNIAQRYHGISVDELKSVNNILNSQSLQPGTKLKVPVKG